MLEVQMNVKAPIVEKYKTCSFCAEIIEIAPDMPPKVRQEL